jgi:hypothetical protein
MTILEQAQTEEQEQLTSEQDVLWQGVQPHEAAPAAAAGQERKWPDLMVASGILLAVNTLLVLWFYFSPSMASTAKSDYPLLEQSPAQTEESWAGGDKPSPFTHTVDTRKKTIRPVQKLTPVIANVDTSQNRDVDSTAYSYSPTSYTRESSDTQPLYSNAVYSGNARFVFTQAANTQNAPSRQAQPSTDDQSKRTSQKQQEQKNTEPKADRPPATGEAVPDTE